MPLVSASWNACFCDLCLQASAPLLHRCACCALYAELATLSLKDALNFPLFCRSQAFSNGVDTPYPATLRIVSHEGDRSPMQEEQQTRKHPVSQVDSSGAMRGWCGGQRAWRCQGVEGGDICMRGGLWEENWAGGQREKEAAGDEKEAKRPQALQGRERQALWAVTGCVVATRRAGHGPVLNAAGRAG